ncbi:hypothetical protein IIC44_01260 [Patescibacteria group bacterium]|nr:hypothetical protein [Patescibacteria group bacterium]
MKIHELSIVQRKIILWGTIVILGSVLFFWWGGNVIETLKTTSLPKVPKELEESLQKTQEQFTFPVFDTIDIPEEILQEYGQSERYE